MDRCGFSHRPVPMRDVSPPKPSKLKDGAVGLDAIEDSPEFSKPSGRAFQITSFLLAGIRRPRNTFVQLRCLQSLEELCVMRGSRRLRLSLPAHDGELQNLLRDCQQLRKLDVVPFWGWRFQVPIDASFFSCWFRTRTRIDDMEACS